MNPAPAQVTYTSNVFASPEFVGGVATALGLMAGHFGLHVMDDPQSQQLLVMFVGMALTGLGHYLFPSASGKLGLTAPAPWSTPAAQNISTGTSVVAVPAPADEKQTTSVIPIAEGKHEVVVTAPPPTDPPAPPPPVTVTSIGGTPNIFTPAAPP